MMPRFSHAGIVCTAALAESTALDMIELSDLEGLACWVRSIDGVPSISLVMVFELKVEEGALRH